jgi:hypothetical protein
MHPTDLCAVSAGKTARHSQHRVRRIDGVRAIDPVDQAEGDFSGPASRIEQDSWLP